MPNKNKVKIVDLFAGPGGLGEGFSSFNGLNNRFSIGVSIEKDEYAHKTLLLRSFYRQFDHRKVPEEYYKFIKTDKFSDDGLKELLNNYPIQGQAARAETICRELGKDDDDIFRAIDKAIGDDIKMKKPWVLIGGPPCQAYSLVGRARNKADKSYSLDNDVRSKLYVEYLRVIARYQPAIFVMENVKGMLSAVVNGDRIINQITSDLKAPSKAVINSKTFAGKRHKYKLYSLTIKHDPEAPFKPEDFIIKSEKYGIPQRRHRVIILGVREDYDPNTISLLKLQNKVSVNDVIRDLKPVYSSFSKRNVNLSNLDNSLAQHSSWKKLLCSFFSNDEIYDPDTREQIGKFLPKLQKAKKSHLKPIHNEWYKNDNLSGYACNHEPRTHIRSDFLRYFFVCCYGKAHKASPRLDNFPKELLPAHKNIKTNKFIDRFKVQLENEPSTTITSHISKDGHYYIHPDPSQCRSLTVREAARLQTFPDDYFFCSNKTQQYHQVGNAVPPLLAKQIAEIVWNILIKSGKVK
ncbi:MAG: DNA (cytosine-5-)-methyltransferase [Phycisphaerae bacterium]|nr:DNA (cytosine-5-)-methyltransferase [Phycisphaerae bacterium]